MQFFNLQNQILIDLKGAEKVKFHSSCICVFYIFSRHTIQTIKPISNFYSKSDSMGIPTLRQQQASTRPNSQRYRNSAESLPTATLSAFSIPGGGATMPLYYKTLTSLGRRPMDSALPGHGAVGGDALIQRR